MCIRDSIKPRALGGRAGIGRILKHRAGIGRHAQALGGDQVDIRLPFGHTPYLNSIKTSQPDGRYRAIGYNSEVRLLYPLLVNEMFIHLILSLIHI